MTSTIRINAPRNLAIDATGTKLFVCTTTENTVTVIDIGTDQVIKVISGFELPNLIHMDHVHRRMYVNNYRASKISVIDTTTCEIITHIALGFNPTNYTLDHTGSNLYVTENTNNRVHVYETSNYSHTHDFAVRSPWGITLNPQSTQAYVACVDRVSIIDIASRQVTEKAIDSKIMVHLMYSPFKERLYSFDSMVRQFYVIDPTTFIIEKIVNSGEDESFIGMVIDQARHRIYITQRPGGSYWVMDPDNEVIIEKVEGLGSGGISGMALVPGSDFAYISNETNNTIDKITI